MAKFSVWTQSGEWKLDDKNWVAQGGEADIYKKDNYAVKIYKDPARVRQMGLVDRVKFAKQWQNLAIAAPVDIALNKNKEAVGVVLPWLNGTPILTAFNNAWRDQNGFDRAACLRVAAELWAVVSGVHSTGALMVDGNEWNYMLDSKMKVWAIDADSWHIPGYPATARMPSIEDVHTKGYTEGSDWFAWAIVTFQLWTGIHPYKGSHPDFKKGDLKSRMAKNVSVFHADVRVPSTARPLSDIPAGLRLWYIDVFEKGVRSSPPVPAAWEQSNIQLQGFQFKKKSSAGDNITLLPVRTDQNLVARGDALWDGTRWLTWDGKVLAEKTASSGATAWKWEAQPHWFITMQRQGSGWALQDDAGLIQHRDGFSHAWRQNGLLLAANDDVVEQWEARKFNNGAWHLHAPWRWSIPAGWRQDNNVRYWHSLGGVCALWSNGVAGRIERFALLDGKKIRNWRQEGPYALVVVEENAGLELWVWNPDNASVAIQKHSVDDANITAAHLGDMLMYWVDDNEGVIRGSRSAEALQGPVPKTTEMCGWHGGFYGLFGDGVEKITKSKAP